MNGMLNVLARLKGRSVADAPVTVHTLLGTNHLLLYLFAVKTLLHFSKLEAQILVYDDGTLGSKEMAILASEVPGVRVLEGPAMLRHPRLRAYPRSRAFLQGHTLGAKLIGVHLFGMSSHHIVLDSDILFLRKPVELVDWCERRGPPGVLYGRDVYRTDSLCLSPEEFKLLGSRFLPWFNSGLLCVPRDRFDLNTCEEVLPYLLSRPNGSFWIQEQTMWAVLGGRGTARPLPRAYAMCGIVTRPRPFRLAELTSVHYSRPKMRFFEEGVPFLFGRQ